LKAIWAVSIIASILIFVLIGYSQDVFALTIVDFQGLGTFTTASIVQFGLTVTGSNTLNISTGEGLGVVGGFSDTRIDKTGNEFVTFDFSGTATNVQYRVRSTSQDPTTCTNCFSLGESQIEAFDSNGVSLGTQNVQGASDIFVSVLFGNVPISSFTVSLLDSDSIQLAFISFDLSPQQPPEEPTKVEICHKGKTIEVSAKAVDKHIEKHGDTEGPCTGEEPPAKEEICHKGKTIEVSEKSKAKHLAKHAGDTEGPC